MTLTHQPIANKLNRRAEVDRENASMDEIERRATPLFYAMMLIAAVVMLVMFGIQTYSAGRDAATKICPPAQAGEKLLYSTQLSNGTVCHYSTGWNAYGRNKIVRNAK